MYTKEMHEWLRSSIEQMPYGEVDFSMDFAEAVKLLEIINAGERVEDEDGQEVYEETCIDTAAHCALEAALAELERLRPDLAEG